MAIDSNTKRRKRLSKLPVGNWANDHLRLLFWDMESDLINSRFYHEIHDEDKAREFIWRALHDSLDFNKPIDPKGLLLGKAVPYGWIYDATDKYLNKALQHYSKENAVFYKELLALKGTNIPLEKARKVFKEWMYVWVPYDQKLEEYHKTYLTDADKKKLRKALSEIKPNIYDYPGVKEGKKMSDETRIGIQMDVLDAILPALPIPAEPQAQEQAEDWRNDYQIHIENMIVGPAIENSGTTSRVFDQTVMRLMLEYIAKRRSHHAIPFQKMNKTTWAWPENRAGEKGERTYFIKREDFGNGGLYHPQLGHVKAVYKVSYRDGLSRQRECEGMWTDFKYLRDAKAYILQRVLEDHFHQLMPRNKGNKK